MLRSLQLELPCDPMTSPRSGQLKQGQNSLQPLGHPAPRPYHETQGLLCHHPCPSANILLCYPTTLSSVKRTAQARRACQSQISNFTDSLRRVGGTGKSPFSFCGLKTLEITHMALKVTQTTKPSPQNKLRGQNRTRSPHPRKSATEKAQGKAQPGSSSARGGGEQPWRPALPFQQELTCPIDSLNPTTARTADGQRSFGYLLFYGEAAAGGTSCSH